MIDVEYIPANRSITVYFGSEGSYTPKHPFRSIVGVYKHHDNTFLYLNTGIVRIEHISFIDLRIKTSTIKK